ncbi:MAG: BglG family transcription antiterminator [Enterococcus lemanii]|jgi:mannitol operon transcriptional antiterminator
MEFSSRLAQILFILLKAGRPIPVKELAKNLNISRRTIFRDLDNVEDALSHYHLTLNRKHKDGFVLEGSDLDKQKLLAELEASDSFDPKNKEARQQKLLEVLLKKDQPEKVYYFADLLQVSESTVRNDLSSIEDWLAAHRISLIKRPGIGISYDEADFRKAVLSYIAETHDRSILNPEVQAEVTALIDENGSGIIDNLTSESRSYFITYTTVAVQRMLCQKYITSTPDNHGFSIRDYDIFVSKLSEEIEESFDITVLKQESIELYIFLEGCKVQYAIPEKAIFEYSDGRISLNLRDLIYEMNERFSPALAFEMNSDEQFIDGMLAHIQPTIINLVNHIRVKNPILDELKNGEVYAEIYKNAEKAAGVLEEKLGVPVPDDEIGFIAMHYSGKLMRMRNTRRVRRTVTIGVICASGIGISILLSTKIKHHFGNKVHVQAMNETKAGTADVDFVVATFPVKTSKTQVNVNVNLTDADFAHISEKIEQFAYSDRQRLLEEQKGNVYDAVLATDEITSIINHFSIQRMSENLNFDQLAAGVSQMLGEENPDSAEKIYQAFVEREKRSTQVIEEYSIMFLHTKTSETDSSIFMVVLPDGERFTDPYFKGAEAVIVMLISDRDNRDELAISRISDEIFENDAFLDRIKAGDQDAVYKRVRTCMEAYLDDYLKALYGKENH